jgi:GDP-mannose transporter
MVGALNKLPIAIFGMLFFGDFVTFTGVVSIFIGNLMILNLAFMAGIVYSIAKSRNNTKANSLPKYSNAKYSNVKTEVLFEDINDEE